LLVTPGALCRIMSPLSLANLLAYDTFPGASTFVVRRTDVVGLAEAFVHTRHRSVPHAVVLCLLQANETV